MDKNKEKSGFLLIDKFETWTSFDVVAKLRNITKIKKIGHAGTLDPFATGLLLVAVGRSATKRMQEFVKADKTYETTLCLGIQSTTHDPEGELTIKKIDEAKIPSMIEIEIVLKKFIGLQKQIPPMHSAKKVGGQKLYKLARKGKTVERQPEEIAIYDLAVIKYAWPKLSLKVTCSSGTYVRVLGADIGMALKTGAYLEELRRTAIGSFFVKDAVILTEINENNWTDFLFQKV